MAYPHGNSSRSAARNLKSIWRHGHWRRAMLCRSCEELMAKDERRRRTTDIRPPRVRPRGVPDQLCSRCGDLLGRDEIERRARKKQSQLEKFGLAGSRRALLKRKDQRN